MATKVEICATRILLKLGEKYGEEKMIPKRHFINNEEIHKMTNIPPHLLSPAIDLLETNGYIKVLRAIGTAPYDFSAIQLTSMGIYEYQRIKSERVAKEEEREIIQKYPAPVGSPFGFTDMDWEMVSTEKSKHNILKVVFGHQFNSDFFDSSSLINNIQSMLTTAVDEYNNKSGLDVTLNFVLLKAGYGEHLFNEIARDIISADIAVFETSDFNPNVMIEMGVALTWGTRVLPIKRKDRPKPPSDISGQTWADYENNGENFTDKEHMEKLISMVERAFRKKKK